MAFDALQEGGAVALRTDDHGPARVVDLGRWKGWGSGNGLAWSGGTRRDRGPTAHPLSRLALVPTVLDGQVEVVCGSCIAEKLIRMEMEGQPER